MPVSLDQFEESLDQSGLVSPADYLRFKSELSADVKQTEAEAIARELVSAGLLTQYQAARIYQGVPKGLVLGNYVVLDKLGAGGMGQVYKAKHRRMDRIVAVKVLSSKAVDSQTAVARFHREVKAAARLSHPNIVTAYDADEADGIHYLVMEYVDGANLGTIVKDRGPLPVKEAVEYMVQATRGFDYAHRSDITHRDIKPDNILVDARGRVRILDMGLARVDNPLGGSSDDGDSEMTEDGQIMGTINYMAPEQAMDTRSADARSDIYSLGCTLYRLLTGETMFDGDTKMIKLVAHRETPAPRLSASRDDIPELLESTFQKMVAKKPEDRFQTMADVASALEAAIADRPTPPKLPKRTIEAPLPPPPPAHAPPIAAAPTVGESSISEGPPPPPAPAPPVFAGNDSSAIVTAEVIDPAAPSSTSLLHPQPPPPPMTADTINMQADIDTSTSVLELPPAAARPRRFLGWLIVATVALAAMVGIGYVLSFALDDKDVVLDNGRSPGFVRPDGSAPPLHLKPLGELATDLLPLIDIDQDGHGFAWTRRGSELVSPGGAGCRVAIPVIPTSGYRIECEFTRISGDGGVYVNLPIGKTNTMLALKDPKNNVSGLQQVNGKDLAFNSSRRPAPPIITGKKHALQIEVKLNKEQSQIVAWLDDQPVVDWQGKISELSDPGGPMSLAAAENLGLAAADPTVFHTARILPTDGELKRGRGNPRKQRSVKAELQATLVGHQGPTTALAFSPNGRHLATGAADDKVVLWHLTDATPAERIPTSSERRGTTALAFASRGGALAIASNDGTIDVRYVTSAARRAGSDRLIQAHSTAPTVLQFERDGRILLSVANGSGIKLWSPDTGRLITSFADGDKTLTSASFGDGGRTIRTAHGTSGIRTWQGRRNALIDSFDTISGNIDALANLGSNDSIACGCGSAGIFLFDLQSGSPYSNLSPDSGSVIHIAASPDGRTLAAAADDGTLWLWDVATRREIATWKPAESQPVAIAFDPSGSYLATGLGDGDVELWKLTFDPPYSDAQSALTISGTISLKSTPQPDPLPQPGPPAPVVDVTPDPVQPSDPPQPVDTPKGPTGLLAELTGHTGTVYSVAFDPRSQLLASSGEDHTARLWSLSTKKQTRTFSGHSDRVLAVTFSPDGRQLATASQDRSASVWNVIDGSRRLTLEDHDDSVFCVAFSPDGGLLATGGKDGEIRIWHAGKGSRLRTFTGHRQAVRQVAFSSGGSTLGSVDLAGELRLWNAETQKVRYTIDAHRAAIWAMSYAPDGRTVATGGADGQLKFWDTVDGELRYSLSDSFGPIQSVAFTPDGDQLATIATDTNTPRSSQVKIWDVDNRRPLASHEMADRKLYAVAVSPDGKLLAVAGSDGVIQVWKLAELTTAWALPTKIKAE